jgi:hypothetical protein
MALFEPGSHLTGLVPAQKLTEVSHPTPRGARRRLIEGLALPTLQS